MVTDLDPGLGDELPELSPAEVMSIEPSNRAGVEPLGPIEYLSSNDTTDEHRMMRARGGEAELPADIEEDGLVVASGGQLGPPTSAVPVGPATGPTIKPLGQDPSTDPVIRPGRSAPSDATLPVQRSRPQEASGQATRPSGPNDIRASAFVGTFGGARRDSDVELVPWRARLRAAKKWLVEAQAQAKRNLPAGRGPLVLLAACGLLVAFGLLTMMTRSRAPIRASVSPVVLSGDRWLELTSDPPQAEVIAEDDGRLLGRTPLAFVVAERSDLAVLIDAPGRVPMRIRLPDTGAVRVELPPKPSESCLVTVEANEGIVLQEHRGTQSVPGKVVVAGAAVFRREGAGRRVGARIVRCPRTEARPMKVELAAAVRRQVRLTAPTGVEVVVDGRPVDRLPADLHSEFAFVEVRLRDDRGGRAVRWVALDAEATTDLRMTNPPAPAPVDEKPPSAKSATLETGQAMPAPTTLSAVEERERPTTRTRIRRGRKSASRYYRRARKALAAGKVSSARSSFRRCLKIDSDYAECHRGLAKVYQRLKQQELATPHLRRYLQLRPNATDAARIRRLLEESSAL